MICLASQVNGLYKLMRNLKPTQVTDPTFIHKHVKHADSFLPFHTIPQKSIWNLRFGHLYNHILYDRSKLHPSITNDNKSLCDTCHFAKQNRNPYVINLSHATSKFSLLHFGIWGSMFASFIHGHQYF